MSDTATVLAIMAICAAFLFMSWSIREELRLTRTELLAILNRHETELEAMRVSKASSAGWMGGAQWGVAAVCGAISFVGGFVCKVLFR